MLQNIPYFSLFEKKAEVQEVETVEMIADLLLRGAKMQMLNKVDMFFYFADVSLL